MNENITEQTLSPKSSPMSVAYKWGLIAAAYFILKMYVVYFMDPENYNPQKGGFVSGLLDLAVSLFVMYMANKEYRDKFNNGFLTFGQGYKTSFLTGLVIIVLITLFMFVFFTYQIDYEQMVLNSLDERIKLLKAKGMSDEDIQKGIEQGKKFMTKEFAVLFSAIFFVIIYAIFALISSAITKRVPKAL
ncbi:MAG: DUF4199 domain-containing protein [Bacteroidia bacterium]|nr:DUF4199 domain-containing protein [Bacteroidia bacterium]